MTDEHASPVEKARAAVAGLWGKFASTYSERAGLLELAAHDLQEGSLTDEMLDQARKTAHMLAGSLGTFGLAEGSRLAAEIESLLESETPQPGKLGEQVFDLSQKLRQAIDHGPTSG